MPSSIVLHLAGKVNPHFDIFGEFGAFFALIAIYNVAIRHQETHLRFPAALKIANFSRKRKKTDALCLDKPQENGYTITAVKLAMRGHHAPMTKCEEC